ncbi:MAG: 50S ribosomal protein L30 [Treponema sp.]|jgi:large subunit ribosomal protein L30|nr:50S ribosomal protein L30 [Treponema sp.]MBR6582238.1 50S ribosomal protein L30 [Treponema sp.]
MAKAKQIKVTLIKSTIGQKPEKVATVRSLGLKKINSSNVIADNDAVRGMVKAVAHLVKVEEI